MTLQLKFTLKPKSLIGILKDFRARERRRGWQLYCCRYVLHPAALSAVRYFIWRGSFPVSAIFFQSSCSVKRPSRKRTRWPADQCTSDQLPEPIKALSLNYSNLLLKLVNVELQKDIDNLFAPSLVAHNLSLPARSNRRYISPSLIQRRCWSQRERKHFQFRSNLVISHFGVTVRSCNKSLSN